MKLSLPASLSKPQPNAGSILNRAQKPAPPKWVIVAVEFVKSFCKVYEASCYAVDLVLKGI
jgi:hypothetical protein